MTFPSRSSHTQAAGASISIPLAFPRPLHPPEYEHTGFVDLAQLVRLDAKVLPVLAHVLQERLQAIGAAIDRAFEDGAHRHQLGIRVEDLPDCLDVSPVPCVEAGTHDLEVVRGQDLTLTRVAREREPSEHGPAVVPLGHQPDLRGLGLDRCSLLQRLLDLGRLGALDHGDVRDHGLECAAVGRVIGPPFEERRRQLAKGLGRLGSRYRTPSKRSTPTSLNGNAGCGLSTDSRSRSTACVIASGARNG